MFRRIIKFTKLKNEKESENEHLVKDGRESGRETLNKKELKDAGIIVGKQNSAVSGPVIKLLLDNMVTEEDITNILETDNDLKTNYCRRVKKCEFCKKKCNMCKVCCMSKEMQMYLVNYALQKLSFISVSKERSFCCQPYVENKRDSIKKIELKASYESDSSEALAKQEIFQKIKRRLKNIKKYYPEIYHFEGNVIEKWGEDSALNTIKQDILDMDEKSSSLFWV